MSAIIIEQAFAAVAAQTIHISVGGSVHHLTTAKPWRFEDHPHLGPIAVDADHEPLAAQPADHDTFWIHYAAWVAQGKRTKTIGDQSWCVYETQMRQQRRLCAAARAAAPTTGGAG